MSETQRKPLFEVIDPSYYGDGSDEDAEFHRALPWWIGRMSNDCWSFGLLLTTGHVLCIDSVDRICRDLNTGAVWVDCTMSTSKPYSLENKHHSVLIAPTSRDRVSVQAAQVVAAFELADT